MTDVLQAFIHTRLFRFLVVGGGAYSAQRGWTFGAEHDHASALPRYFTLQAGCAAFSGLVSHVAVTRFGLSPVAMSALATVAASAASYIVSSRWVFPARR